MESPVISRRTVAGVIALSLGLAVLGFRVYALNVSTAIELTERTRELEYIKDVAGRVYLYASQYGRPVYRWDLHARHITAAESTDVVQLREALWNGPLSYSWDASGFEISWPHARRADEPRVTYRFDGRRPYPTQLASWPASASDYAKRRLIALTPKPIPGMH
jgi:hypothetical protein